MEYWSNEKEDAKKELSQHSITPVLQYSSFPVLHYSKVLLIVSK